MNNLDKIKNLLQHTDESDSQYNAEKFNGVYHTINILGETLNGQRIPSYRIKNIDYDFTNKTILDIGSNQGGMLYEIQSKIKQGVGIDFDYRLVNVANKISQVENYHHLRFYVFDLMKEDFNLLNNFSNEKYDVIFLLSVCKWIKNWKDLITWVHSNSSHCLFETNGKPHLQDEQINFLKSVYRKVIIIHEHSNDDPGQKRRKTLWCSR